MKQYAKIMHCAHHQGKMHNEAQRIWQDIRISKKPFSI